MYFTIYTITTTGYGDIIPITGTAKFIASVSNLYELLFMVFIFNALFTSTISSMFFSSNFHHKLSSKLQEQILNSNFIKVLSDRLDEYKNQSK